MLRNVPVLAVVLLLLVVGGDSETGASANICSSNPNIKSEVVEIYNEDEQRYVKETKVTLKIGLHESVCFEVREQGGYTPINVFTISFTDVDSMFTYKNSYDFAVPESKVTCVCDCPGLEDQCSPIRDSCKEEADQSHLCWNYYKGDQLSDGCGIFEAMGSAEVCCAVDLSAYRNQTYKAFQVSTPTTRGRFTFNSAKPNTTASFMANLDKTSRIFLDADTAISFDTPGSSVVIPDGWYYGALNSEEVRTNVQINGLNEWSFSKLGWLKYGTDGRLQYSDSELSKTFSAEATSCPDNRLNVDFSSSYANRDIEESQRLEQYFASTIRRVVRKDDRRHFLVYFRQFEKLNVQMTFRATYTVVPHKYGSRFQEFAGAALLDKHSNRYLNITVYGAYGTLYGQLQQHGKTIESFDFTVPSKTTAEGEPIPMQYSNYVQVTQWCITTAPTFLCIHTGTTTTSACKMISCNSVRNDDFELPSTNIRYEVGYRESLLDARVWKKYTNPAEWFNGITGLQEAVCMTAVLASTALLILIVVLVVKCTPLRFRVAGVLARSGLVVVEQREKLERYEASGGWWCEGRCCCGGGGSEGSSSSGEIEMDEMERGYRGYKDGGYRGEMNDGYYKDIGYHDDEYPDEGYHHVGYLDDRDEMSYGSYDDEDEGSSVSDDDGQHPLRLIAEEDLSSSIYSSSELSG